MEREKLDRIIEREEAKKVKPEDDEKPFYFRNRKKEDE